MTTSARSATSAAELAGLAPSPTKASMAWRERLKTWTVCPAASKRWVMGRPIFPRPTKPTSIVAQRIKLLEVQDLSWFRSARRGDRFEATAGLIDLAREWVAHGIDDEPRSSQDAVQTDAVLDAEAIQQVEEVLGSEVARRTGTGKGAATQAACRAVEMREPELQASHDIGHGDATRIVKMHAPLVERRQIKQRVHDSANVARGGNADRVTQDDLLDAQFEQALRDAVDGFWRDRAFVGTAEDD